MIRTGPSIKQRRYGFVKPYLITLFMLIDGLGGLVFRTRSQPPQHPRRILLINLAHIGDVVMSTPAIHAVRLANPSAHLAVMVGPWGAGVLKNNPDVDEVLVYHAAWWYRSGSRRALSSAAQPFSYMSMLHTCSVGSLYRLLKNGRFDVSIDFKSFFQENLAVCRAGIPWRVGFGIYGGGFLLSHVPDYPWYSHVVERNLALVRDSGIGVDCRDCQEWPQVFFSDEDRSAVQVFLEAHGVGDSDRLVALHIGAGYPSKRWPVARYARLADELVGIYGIRVVLVGGNDDLPLIQEMVTAVASGLLIAAGKLSITATTALLSRCCLFIGNDSGPAHLATAIGIQAIVLFSGENDAPCWRPYGDNCTVIGKSVDCSPCGRRVCNRGHECMTGISVEEVIEAVKGSRSLA